MDPTNNLPTNYNNPNAQMEPTIQTPPTPNTSPQIAAPTEEEQDNENANNNNSTQDTLEIAEIRDNIVILKDGSFHAVLKAQAINFDLMSSQEKESIEYAYQSFLNSLYFPIQISVLSRRVDAETYLKKLETSLQGQRNMLLSVLTEDYLDFIADLVESRDIMSKQFYVIIPYYDTDFTKEKVGNLGRNLFSRIKLWGKKDAPLIVDEQTLEKAKRELRYRLQTVDAGLRGCSIYSELLNTSQLIGLYYEFYNPDTANYTAPKNFHDFTAPYVKKGDNSNIKNNPSNIPAETYHPSIDTEPVIDNPIEEPPINDRQNSSPSDEEYIDEQKINSQ